MPRSDRHPPARPEQDGPGQDGPGQDGPGQDGPGQDGPAGADRIEALAGRVRAAGAVDPDEVAAFLEESGITDQMVRGRYGEPDVFALAERVHTRLPVRRTEHRHAAAPVRWDWRVLPRPQLLGVRVVALTALGVAAWWLGAAALLPALIGLPAGELLAAWHQGRVRWGLGSYDTALAWRRHLRGLGWATLAALAPPLLGAAALGGIALGGAGLSGARLGAGGLGAEGLGRTGLAGAADLAGWLGGSGSAPAAGSLALAAGVLVAGGYAVLLVLAVRRRLVAGTVLAAGCGMCVALADPASVRVALVAAGYLAGLVLTAQAVFDPEAVLDSESSAHATGRRGRGRGWQRGQ